DRQAAGGLAEGADTVLRHDVVGSHRRLLSVSLPRAGLLYERLPVPARWRQARTLARAAPERPNPLPCDGRGKSTDCRLSAPERGPGGEINAGDRQRARRCPTAARVGVRGAARGRVAS